MLWLVLIKAAKTQKLKLECAIIPTRFGKQRKQPATKIARKMRDFLLMLNKRISFLMPHQICQDSSLKTKMERQKIKTNIKGLSNQPKR